VNPVIVEVVDFLPSPAAAYQQKLKNLEGGAAVLRRCLSVLPLRRRFGPEEVPVL